MSELTPEHQAAVTRRDVPFILVALATGVAWLYLGRSLTFWYDEWRSITFDGGLGDFFRPVNEHWSTFPLVMYRATFELVELRSYLPYLAQVIVLHLVAVTGAYVLMRRRVGAFAASLLSLPLLLLGAGAENLFWAFQTGFVGSVAFGVWALLLIEQPERRAATFASALLVGSLMASGIGLFFVVAVAGRTIFERAFRPRVLAVVPPAIAYLVWYALVGGEAVGTTGKLADPVSVVRFALRGIGHSVEVMAGVDRLSTNGIVGVAVFAFLCTVTVRRATRGQPQGLAIGCLVGATAMYAVIGITRAELDSDYTRASRYVYIAAFLLVLCITDLFKSKLAQLVPLRSPRIAAVAALVGLALAWVIVVNLSSLWTLRTQFQYQADLTRAIIALAIEHEGEPWVDPGAGLDLMPPAGELPAFIERHGSPLQDRFAPIVPTTLGLRVREDAMLLLIGRNFRVEPSDVLVQPVAVRSVEAIAGKVEAFGACFRIQPQSRPGDVGVRMIIDGGTRIRSTSTVAAAGRVGLSHGTGPTRHIALALMRGTSADVVVPDADKRPWQLVIQLSDLRGLATFCPGRA